LNRANTPALRIWLRPTAWIAPTSGDFCGSLRLHRKSSRGFSTGMSRRRLAWRSSAMTCRSCGRSRSGASRSIRESAGGETHLCAFALGRSRSGLSIFAQSHSHRIRNGAKRLTESSFVGSPSHTLCVHVLVELGVFRVNNLRRSPKVEFSLGPHFGHSRTRTQEGSAKWHGTSSIQ